MTMEKRHNIGCRMTVLQQAEMEYLGLSKFTIVTHFFTKTKFPG